LEPFSVAKNALTPVSTMSERPDNASVSRHRGVIVKARRSGLMQPAQDLRALFLGRPAKLTNAPWPWRWRAACPPVAQGKAAYSSRSSD